MHLNKLLGRRMGRGGIAQAKEVLKFSYMLNSTVGASVKQPQESYLVPVTLIEGRQGLGTNTPNICCLAEGQQH